jgi:hypothetical protein
MPMFVRALIMKLCKEAGVLASDILLRASEARSPRLSPFKDALEDWRTCHCYKLIQSLEAAATAPQANTYMNALHHAHLRAMHHGFVYLLCCIAPLPRAHP